MMDEYKDKTMDELVAQASELAMLQGWYRYYTKMQGDYGAAQRKDYDDKINAQLVRMRNTLELLRLMN